MFPSEATLRELSSGMNVLNKKVTDLENIFKQVLPALKENTQALKENTKAKSR